MDDSLKGSSDSMCKLSPHIWTYQGADDMGKERSVRQLSLVCARTLL